MTLAALIRALPEDLQIILADVGSAGGIHDRWNPIRHHVSAVLFDPLDESTGSGRDRYFPVALARGDGRATLHITKRVTMTSTLLPNSVWLARFWDKPEHTQIVSTLEIPTDSLDNVMRQNGIAPDVVKIDVQGGEFDVLAGARSCLANSIFLVEAELSFFERYSGLKTFSEIVSMMSECGFDLIDVNRIKRYRYRNASGVVNPGIGRGDRAGRLAFCDAIFLLNDEALLQRVTADEAIGSPHLALKVILVLLIYGKADIAAWIFDAVADRIDPPIRDALSRYLRSLGGRHFGKKGLHRALDYLARKV